jgi:hypothetical protein
MAKLGGTKSWVAATGIALLVAFVVVPALSGAASATSAPTGLTPAATSGSWAYGGEGWSNNTLVSGNATLTWDAMFGWTVVFTATATAPNVTMIEEQRTVGITVSATYQGPVQTLSYHFHAQEVDVAFANLTDQATVYVADQAVPALGILNASASIQGAIDESISQTIDSHTRGASLDVTGSAKSNVAFAPSLGLVPLNLSGVSMWNSSATASPSATWNLAWTWSDQGFNGTTGSGSGAKSGNVSATGPVGLTGYKIAVIHPFADHKVRIGVVLIVAGPFDCYDAYVFVPHDFDLFGGAAQSYDSLGFGTAAISAETLYLSSGVGATSVSAADTTFGSNDQTVNAQGSPSGGPAPAVSSNPGTTVEGQPMSVAQAQSEANALTQQGSPAASSMGGALLLGLVVAAVAVIVGTVGVIEWRSFARRKSPPQLVGGYSASWIDGAPPAASRPATPLAPSGPAEEPGTLEGPQGPP